MRTAYWSRVASRKRQLARHPTSELYQPGQVHLTAGMGHDPLGGDAAVAGGVVDAADDGIGRHQAARRPRLDGLVRLGPTAEGEVDPGGDWPAP